MKDDEDKDDEDKDDEDKDDESNEDVNKEGDNNKSSDAGSDDGNEVQFFLFDLVLLLKLFLGPDFLILTHGFV